MSFVEIFGIEEPEEGGEQEEFQPPVWFSPPEGELGAVVPYGMQLARSDRGVIALSHIVAYSTGAAFEFVAQARGVSQAQAQNLFHAQHGYGQDELPDGFLRLGLELADGQRVSNIRRHRPFDPRTVPDGPVFTPHAGGGGSSSRGRVSMRPGYWLWPLPPAGPLRITCEWPIVDIPITTVEIDADAISSDTGQAVQLWPSD